VVGSDSTTIYGVLCRDIDVVGSLLLQEGEESRQAAPFAEKIDPVSVSSIIKTLFNYRVES